MRSSLSGLGNRQPLSDAELHDLRCQAWQMGIAILVVREIGDPATRQGVIKECEKRFGRTLA